MQTLNPDSDTWQTTKAWAENEKQRATAKIVAKGLPQDETEFWRGYLKAMQALLLLPETLKVKPKIHENYD